MVLRYVTLGEKKNDSRGRNWRGGKDSSERLFSYKIQFIKTIRFFFYIHLSKPHPKLVVYLTTERGLRIFQAKILLIAEMVDALYIPTLLSHINTHCQCILTLKNRNFPFPPTKNNIITSYRRKVLQRDSSHTSVACLLSRDQISSTKNIPVGTRTRVYKGCKKKLENFSHNLLLKNGPPEHKDDKKFENSRL